VGGLLVRALLRRDEEVETIRSWASALEAEGAVVLTDLKGSPRPPKIGRHIPDVFAWMPDGSQLAIEVENEKSVERTHARRQDQTFTRWAARSKKRAYIQDVVPGGKGRKS